MFLWEALSELSPGSSKTTMRSWLNGSRVLVDDRKVNQGQLELKPGQIVELRKKGLVHTDTLQILYRDRQLVVIYKPPGLLSVSTETEKENTAHKTLKNLLKTPHIYVVHRLDRGTSGVMLFARTKKAQDQLKNRFEKRLLKRQYLAIVEGQVKGDKGTWKSYLFEDENYHVHETSDPKRGKLAITHYQVVKRAKRNTWLECQLETGKKNQIRVHCQSAGHSIVGDKKYGAKTNTLGRLCLHAARLTFNHPTTGKKMVFESPIPKEMQ